MFGDVRTPALVLLHADPDKLASDLKPGDPVCHPHGASYTATTKRLLATLPTPTSRASESTGRRLPDDPATCARLSQLALSGSFPLTMPKVQNLYSY